MFSRDLLFCFVKASRAAKGERGQKVSHALRRARKQSGKKVDVDLEYSACPAGFGNFLMEEDTSYAPRGQVKLGDFFDVRDGVAVRHGRCLYSHPTSRCMLTHPA